METAKNIVEKFSEYKYHIAMVKANAYGHGMYVINEMINISLNCFHSAPCNMSILAECFCFIGKIFAL